MDAYTYWRAVIIIILAVASITAVGVFFAACVVSGRISRREEGKK